jgi:hypothetical protein
VETWACSSDLFSVLIGSCWGQGTIGEGSVLPFILFFSMHQMMKSCTYQMYHMTTVCCGGSEKQNQNVTAKYNYKNETRSVNGKTAFFFFLLSWLSVLDLKITQNFSTMNFCSYIADYCFVLIHWWFLHFDVLKIES